MRSPISPLHNYQLKSTLLRNDEQLLYEFNELLCAFNDSTSDSTSDFTLDSTSDFTIDSTSDFTLDSTSDFTLDSTSDSILDSILVSRFNSTLDSTLAWSLASSIASRFASGFASGLTPRLASRLASRLGLPSVFISRELASKELAPRELASKELAPRELASTDLASRSLILREIAARVASRVASRSHWIYDLAGRFELDSTFDFVSNSVVDLQSNSMLDLILDFPLDLVLDSSFESTLKSISFRVFHSRLYPALYLTLHSKLDPLLASTLARVNELDRLFLRAEKNGMLRDVIAGIVEDSIHPALCTMSKIRNFGLELCVDDFLSGRESLVAQVRRLESLIAILIDAESASGLEFAYNALVLAVVLSIVYQYLVGYVDKGGTKTYNSGSLEFRATYVSLLLFQGAYVWIKFRDVAKRTVSRRYRTDKSGNLKFGKWEPKFKPPREKDVATGTSQEFQCLRLAGYDTKRDGEVVCQIAGFYYGEDEGLVELEDGFRFDIPPMSEQERKLSGMQKWNWVSDKAKEVFTQDFRKAHDQWRKSRRIMPEHVELPAGQAVGNVNDLHGDTVPQPLSDVSDGADALVDNQQPLFDLPTTRSVRTDEILSFGGTSEADLSSVFKEFGEGLGACHSTGPLTYLKTFDSIDFETLTLDVTFPAASTSQVMSPSDAEDHYEVYLWQ